MRRTCSLGVRLATRCRDHTERVGAPGVIAACPACSLPVASRTRWASTAGSTSGLDAHDLAVRVDQERDPRGHGQELAGNAVGPRDIPRFVGHHGKAGCAPCGTCGGSRRNRATRRTRPRLPARACRRRRGTRTPAWCTPAYRPWDRSTPPPSFPWRSPQLHRVALSVLADYVRRGRADRQQPDVAVGRRALPHPAARTATAMIVRATELMLAIVASCSNRAGPKQPIVSTRPPHRRATLLAHVVAGVPAGVLLQVVLVVLLGRVNGPASTISVTIGRFHLPDCVDPRLHLLRRLPLLGRRHEDRRAVLRADVVALAVGWSGRACWKNHFSSRSAYEISSGRTRSAPPRRGPWCRRARPRTSGSGVCRRCSRPRSRARPGTSRRISSMPQKQPPARMTVSRVACGAVAFRPEAASSEPEAAG